MFYPIEHLVRAMAHFLSEYLKNSISLQLVVILWTPYGE